MKLRGGSHNAKVSGYKLNIFAAQKPANMATDTKKLSASHQHDFAIFFKYSMNLQKIIYDFIIWRRRGSRINIYVHMCVCK